MSFPRSPAVAVWLLAAAGVHSMGAAWADTAQAGKAHPWVLVAVFWGVALLSISIHYLLLYLAQAAVWTRRWWHQHAAQRARLRTRTVIAAARATNTLRRSARQLGQRHEMVATAASLAAQGWEATRRAWEQQVAGARRAPSALTGALIGWSRSALKALRA